MPSAPAVPRLTYLRIKNYRALRDVELRDLTPLTVLIGPNGSGKSTVLDALDFLAEAVRGNMQQAWEKRNRFAGMRTRGSEGNILFVVEVVGHELINYEVEIIEQNGAVLRINEEIIYLQDDGSQRDLLLFKEEPYQEFSIRTFRQLSSQDEKGVISRKLYDALTSYRLLHLTDDHLKGYSDAGPRERLSGNGDNLPNVLYYYHQRHPEVLARLSEKLREWVPGLAEVVPEIISDERLLLRFRDAPFEKLLPTQVMSGGTMRLAALLAVLYEPGAGGLLGLEEPENELHPQLLPRLAEELTQATAHRQLLVATHSPFLLDSLEPEQVWVLHRGPDGYTQATRAADIPHVKELVEDGSPLGYLWSSNSLAVANPINPQPAAPDAR